MGIVTRVRLLGLWLGGGLRIGWSLVRFMRTPVETVTGVMHLGQALHRHDTEADNCTGLVVHWGQHIAWTVVSMLAHSQTCKTKLVSNLHNRQLTCDLAS